MPRQWKHIHRLDFINAETERLKQFQVAGERFRAAGNVDDCFGREFRTGTDKIRG